MEAPSSGPNANVIEIVLPTYQLKPEEGCKVSIYLKFLSYPILSYPILMDGRNPYVYDYSIVLHRYAVIFVFNPSFLLLF